MPGLPRASGDKHVSSFKAAGWQVNHIEGSHYILINDQSDIHLSIHVHKNKALGIGLFKKLISKAGMTNEEYMEYFYGK
ncbi:MAG TPA: type II toxin-antitoxin system HicA family toxin [Methanosarcinaceae archaeon]|nr:type II toxin-antitoxin system HicA family toxin [Methanosarcinaceae archaeon]